MRAIIPSLSVKGFQAVLSCLDKIGDDIIVEARPDRFTLSTLNITRSAFANFTFTRTFFESYHLDTSAEAIRHDEQGPYLRCSVLAKALVSACRIRGNVEQKVEKVCLFMNAAEGVGESCRLTVEIIFKYGFIKIHKLLYESCPEPLHVLDSIEACPSSWKLPAVALIGFTDHFSSKAEEISMKCTQDGITFKTASSDESGSKKIGTTVVPISRSAMELYKLQDGIELTFSMKEFKAIIAFAVTLRLPLEGYFDARCRPFLLAVEAENIVSANFALATVIDNNDLQGLPSSEQAIKMEGIKSSTAANASRKNSHPDLDLTQPENALFLDDDEDWTGALDDLEMEEAAPAVADNVGRNVVDPSPANPGTLDMNNAPTLSAAVDENVLEIEEGFLPRTNKRKSKRARFSFDEDD
ncbi:Rad9-domain-containing protein [Gamsiella multidivaricata]|uniref:Rad9-domain-containing protein n=1 Tax=Gamsiella multidivaricata TaxID=101098 RepID=UPI00221FF178|nr:Rad9-domain-containing protein [Gamsiella multidivaricata]KAI7819521.1 Rad9-domain-containing protein [Gamsiella multidivaricata]